MTDRYVTIYLRDHLAGGRAGLDFCRRVMRANEANTVGDRLESMVADLEEEADTLRRVLELLDVEPSQLKVAGARLAEKLGRLKLNGDLRRYSPLSRLLELEGLMAATETRRGLWLTLKEARHLYPALDELPVSRLSRRAEQHLVMLEELHQKAARSMLKQGWDRDEKGRSGDGRPPA